MGKNEKNHPALFCGTYELTLEKGKIIIPEAVLQKLEAESPEEKLLYFFPHSCLFLYSERGMRDLVTEAMMRYHDQTVARRIWHTASQFSEKWSPEGAVAIPEALIKQYEFSSDERLVLVGTMNRMELWKCDDWKQEQEKMQTLLEPYLGDIEDLLN